MVSNLFPLDTLLNELYNKGLLSVRSFNALFNAGLTTISEVVNYIQKGGSLMTLPHLGKKSYEETMGFFEPYLSPLLNVELSTKNALGNAIFQNSQEQEINQYIKRTFAKYYYAALSSEDVKYDTFKRKFSNVQDIWEAILTDSEKLFKPDIASSFFQNFIACITVYRIINGVINDLDKDKIGIPIVYDLCKIRHRFNHNPYLTSVMFALNSLGEIKNMFLSDYFQTKLTQQSVRTQNVITKEIGDFPNMLSFILADMNPINLKSMGKQSAIEFKLFGNDILQKTEEVSRTDTNCIYLLFYKSTFSFIPQNKWATIEYFFKINGHMPMFLVLLNYLLQSNQRNDNILKEYYGIGCSRKTIGEISETYKVSKQTVANIINDTNIPVYFKSHWSYYRFLSEKFLSSKTSNYKDINDSEFLYLNYVSYLGLCCIIKPYRLFEYKEKYYIIDKAIWKNYNFKKTFSYINSLANNIHLEDIRVDFHSLITHLQKDYNRQYYIAIKKTLRTIMEDNYNVDINDSEVIFKANKINKAKEIYKILVDKGTPLSEYEIFDIFKKKYPQESLHEGYALKKLLSQVDISFDRGRQVFYLQKWNDGKFYTGNLIDKIYQILDKSDQPLNAENIYKDVILHFPNTTLAAIKSTLIYGMNSRFLRYENEHYGIVGKEYKSNLMRVAVPRRCRYSFNERFKMYKDFVEKNKRYPNLSQNANEEERSLCRWRHNVDKNNIETTEEQITELKKFELSHNMQGLFNK